MSTKITLKGATSGQVDIVAPDVAGSTTINTPAKSGDLALTGMTVQRLTSGTAATYTTPANCKWLRVRMVGGGAGGAGTNGSNANAPGVSGGATSFGTWTANGGTGATSGGAGGTGGTNGTGTLIFRMAGNPGGQFIGGSALGSQNGASGPWGGAGISGYNSSALSAAAANSGAGGGGGSATGWNAAGGAAGEYVEFIITSPAASYTYTIGTGGTGGGGGYNGSSGGSGVIIVEEYY